ncbi:nuclear transport factor 2 family protein [Streptomyces xantholiticus]
MTAADALASAPGQFLADFFTSLTEDILRGSEDPEPVVARHFTPGIVQVSDGITLDRDRLVAHIRPVRKNTVDCLYEVHEALADGTRVAARFTLHARTRKGRTISTEVHFIGEFTPDGRMLRAHQLTRVLPEPKQEQL